jgi:hypothetical protein
MAHTIPITESQGTENICVHWHSIIQLEMVATSLREKIYHDPLVSSTQSSSIRGEARKTCPLYNMLVLALLQLKKDNAVGEYYRRVKQLRHEIRVFSLCLDEVRLTMLY